MILKSCTIEQITLTIEQAREKGLIGGFVWSESFAARYPNAVIYEYRFNDAVGGHTWDEIADFETLCEFQRAAELAAV